jgi:hypothetical protein
VAGEAERLVGWAVGGGRGRACSWQLAFCCGQLAAVAGLESGVWSLESGVWSLESGVWCLESGVWSLESGAAGNLGLGGCCRIADGQQTGLGKRGARDTGAAGSCSQPHACA